MLGLNSLLWALGSRLPLDQRAREGKLGIGHWALGAGRGHVEGIVGSVAMTPAAPHSGHSRLATSWMLQWGLFCLGRVVGGRRISSSSL